MQMESDWIVWLASSPWASPLHLIRKPDGFWQPCGEYFQLKDVTVPDTYPFPNMMDFSAGFVTCTFFLIDLRKGYHRTMHPADIPLTATITPFGG
jgi:hypothetical protein